MGLISAKMPWINTGFAPHSLAHWLWQQPLWTPVMLLKTRQTPIWGLLGSRCCSTLAPRRAIKVCERKQEDIGRLGSLCCQPAACAEPRLWASFLTDMMKEPHNITVMTIFLKNFMVCNVLQLLKVEELVASSKFSSADFWFSVLSTISQVRGCKEATCQAYFSWPTIFFEVQNWVCFSFA